MMPVKTLDAEAFKPYGIIIEQPDRSKVFSVLLTENSKTGWRLGYLVMGPSAVDSLEAHPESYETFEPVSGTAVLIVAGEKTPEQMEAFLLDRPVCVGKKIWHAVRVLSASAEIKITENAEVASVHYKLEKPVDIGIA